MESSQDPQLPKGSAGISRKEFLLYGGAAALLAACGGTASTTTGATATTAATTTTAAAATTTAAAETTAAAPLTVPRIAFTAGTFPSIVNGKVGPLDYGPQFGLDYTDADILTFDSHATAAQAVLAGEADVLAGALTATLALIQQGQNFKYFCPFSNGNDLLLIGTNDVNDINMVTDSATVIGIDSLGGLVNFVTNALLAAKGVEVNVEDLNTVILEDSPLRTAALVNGDIDVALVHQFDIPGIQEQLGEENVHVLATLWEDVTGIIFETFAAHADWLDENLEAATALTAAMLTGNREISKSFDRYIEAINDYVEGGASNEDNLRIIWDLARQFEFWSYNGDLEADAIEFTIKAAQQSGLLGDVSDIDVVDRRAMDAALEMIGTVTVDEITSGG